MNWFSQATEGLANLNVRTILIAVGVLMVLLASLRLAAPRRRGEHWLAENLQVVVSVVVVVFLIIRPFLFQAFYIPSGSMEPTLRGPREAPAAPQASGDRLLVNKLIYRLGNPRRFDIAVFRAPRHASPDEKEFIKRVIGLPGETIEVVAPRVLVDGRPAFALSAEGSFGTVAPQDRARPERSISGRTARLSYSGIPFRLMAQPVLDITYSPHQLRVNGRIELTDLEGRIERSSDLAAYGAEPGVFGSVYTIAGEPRLILITGGELRYDPGHVTIDGRRLAEGYLAEAPSYAMAARRLGPDEYFMMGDNRNNSNDSHVWGALTRDRIIGRAEIVFWPAARFNLIHWWLVSLVGGLIVGYNVFQRVLGGRGAPE